MKEPLPFRERTSGILLHPTSLPGPHGIGDLGPSARRFIDFLQAAHQRWWQMLPIGPPGGGNSPYDSPSAFAGSALLISLELLVKAGLLRRSELNASEALANRARAKYEAAARFRLPLLRRAFERFDALPARERRGFEGFRARAQNWLRDYALFSALGKAHDTPDWTTWDEELRRRQKAALARAEDALANEIRFHEFLQYLFEDQWSKLRSYAHERGVLLLGDMPMFVAHHGVDVWSHQRLFHLDRDGRKTVVAGVPPDPFSATGQLWGNALYRWPVIRATGYQWWIDRFRSSLEHFDAVRIDHFIGLHRCWEVPAQAKDARRGRFVRVPGAELLDTARSTLAGLPFVAEDLGLVTPEVKALRKRFDLPGMAVLQFGFGEFGGREHEPHNYDRCLVAYTGTHDNDTFMGWLRSRPPRDASRKEAQAFVDVRARLRSYIGDDRELNWQAIRALLVSVADTVIFPMQDLLGLGSEARMNVPGVGTGNWRWRVTDEQLSPELAERMAALCAVSQRDRHMRS